MTSTTEPRAAVPDDAAVSDDAETINTFGEGELTSLVRRWMAVGSVVQDRVRRDSLLQVAPDPGAPEPGAPEPVVSTAVEAQEAETVDAAASLPTPGDPLDGPLVDSVDDPLVSLVDSLVEARDLANDGAADRCVDGARDEAAAPLRFPTLPRRTTVDVEATPASRIAVLVDARRVSAEMATELLARLVGRGSVNVFRAYADWGRQEVSAWARQTPVEGLHSFHQFPDDDEQALVALAIDAVDIARSSAVDEVVIAGDLTAALPLVHRLHAAGVRVVAVGAGRTPFDVRAASDAFIDLGLVEPRAYVTAGRHRA